MLLIQINKNFYSNNDDVLICIYKLLYKLFIYLLNF